VYVAKIRVLFDMLNNESDNYYFAIVIRVKEVDFRDILSISSLVVRVNINKTRKIL